jgi:hypothetical protein
MKSACNAILYIIVILSIAVSSCSTGDMETPESEFDVPPSGYVIKFERRGGYLGVNDKFWIYPDGRVLNSVGKTARIPSDLVVRWMEIIPADAVPASKKAPLLASVSQDCYVYGITVYEKSETRALSLFCTDKYSLSEEGDSTVIDIGSIRDSLMNLSWE